MFNLFLQEGKERELLLHQLMLVTYRDPDMRYGNLRKALALSVFAGHTGYHHFQITGAYGDGQHRNITSLIVNLRRNSSCSGKLKSYDLVEPERSVIRDLYSVQPQRFGTFIENRFKEVFPKYPAYETLLPYIESYKKPRFPTNVLHNTYLHDLFITLMSNIGQNINVLHYPELTVLSKDKLTNDTTSYLLCEGSFRFRPDDLVLFCTKRIQRYMTEAVFVELDTGSQQVTALTHKIGNYSNLLYRNGAVSSLGAPCNVYQTRDLWNCHLSVVFCITRMRDNVLENLISFTQKQIRKSAAVLIDYLKTYAGSSMYDCTEFAKTLSITARTAPGDNMVLVQRAFFLLSGYFPECTTIKELITLVSRIDFKSKSWRASVYNERVCIAYYLSRRDLIFSKIVGDFYEAAFLQGKQFFAIPNQVMDDYINYLFPADFSIFQNLFKALATEGFIVQMQDVKEIGPVTVHNITFPNGIERKVDGLKIIVENFSMDISSRFRLRTIFANAMPTNCIVVIFILPEDIHDLRVFLHNHKKILIDEMDCHFPGHLAPVIYNMDSFSNFCNLPDAYVPAIYPMIDGTFESEHVRIGEQERYLFLTSDKNNWYDLQLQQRKTQDYQSVDESEDFIYV